MAANSSLSRCHYFRMISTSSEYYQILAALNMLSLTGTINFSRTSAGIRSGTVNAHLVDRSRISSSLPE